VRSLGVLVGLTLCASVATTAQAKCVGWSVQVWPEPQAPLPANGRILVSGYGMAEGPVTAIHKQQPVLVGLTETVPLEVEAIYAGGRSTTQVLLKPARALQVGSWYELRLSAPVSGEETIDLNIWEAGGYRHLSWSVVEADHARPEWRAAQWRAAPQSAGSETHHYGCGPSVFQFYKVEAEDESRLWFLAVVRRADGTGTPQRHLVRGKQESAPAPPRRILAMHPGVRNVQSIALGHEMCGGGFQFDTGVEYFVDVFAVDAAGNSSAAPGGTLTLIGPPGWKSWRRGGFKEAMREVLGPP
jgi:hypothetical protein